MPPPASPLSLLRSLPTDAARALWKAVLWERRSSAAAAAPATADAAFEGRFDVVVVGGGVNGSSTAFELAGRGLRVALLEQFDFLHRRGSSHGESRIIRRTYPQSHYTAGMVQAYELWDEAQREYGSSVFTRTGGLDFAPAGNAALQQLVASSLEHGVAHAQLSPAEVAACFPAFRLPPGYTAVWQENAGVLNATKAVAMFQALAARRGAVLRDRTPALAVTHVADGVRVDTPRGALHADKVVLACGAWTSKVLYGLGVDVAATLKAVPVAVSYWRCKDAAAAELLAAARCPVAIGYTGAGLGHAAEAECYLTPVLELPGLVKVSLHLPEHLWGPALSDADVRLMAPPEAIVREHVIPFIQRFLPGVDCTAPAMVEGCMYTMTPDHDFLLDLLPGGRGRVAVCSACSGHGFKFAPLVGAAMADLVQTGDTQRLGDRRRFGIARLLPHARL